MTEAATEYVHPQWTDDEVKWIIRHSRATDTLTFGPFDTPEEAMAWALRNHVGSAPQPLIPPRVEDGGYSALWAGWRHGAER